MLADDGEDAPIADDVFDAVVKVLAAWKWKARPVGVVSMPSERWPHLIESLAKRLSQVGRLAYLGQLRYQSGSPGRQFNSAKRVEAVSRALVLPDELAASVAEAAGPLLLVDDRVDSGWTMTIAASLLRQAGAQAVLPLALATTM